MAFKKEASIKGLDRVFAVSPEARPYPMRDNGFVNTRGGNFQYKRDMENESNQEFVLKVTVDKDLKGLKISTVNGSGIQAVDITKLANNDMLLEKVNFIFDGFVDRNVFVEIKD